MADEPTCQQCRYSIGSLQGLWCQLYNQPAPIFICTKYEREPGTMEPEK